MTGLTEFFQNAYYHCLHYIVNKKLHWFERVFWVFWVILSMVGVLYIVKQSVYHFYHTRATIRIRTDYLDFKTPFPAIFFCEKEEIRDKIPKMLEDFNYTITDRRSKANVENFVRKATFIRPMGSHPSFPSCRNDEEACRFMDTFKNNLSAFLTHVRATCDEIFTSCAYNGQEFNCCEDFLPVDTFEGKCYAINSFNAIIENMTRKEDNFGERFPKGKPVAKKLLKYIIEHVPEKDPGILSVELEHTNLFVWYLGNTYVPTKMYQKNNQFRVMEKSYKVLDVSLRVMELTIDASVFILEQERRNCRFWYETETMTAFKVYSISGCEIDCLRRAQLMYCGCVLHLLPNQNGLKDKHCDINGIGCISEKPEIEKFLTYNCSCVSTCAFMEVFPVGAVPNDDSIKTESFRNSRSKRRINFLVRAPTERYILHANEEPLDFIVNIGGAISLCIGCSFLSLVQIFYYFLLKPLNECLLKKKQEEMLIKTTKIQKAILQQKRKMQIKILEENIQQKIAGKKLH